MIIAGLVMPVFMLSGCSENESSFLPMVTTGFGHTSVLREDGTIWSFGRNEEGQLGNGNRISQFAPVRAIFNPFTHGGVTYYPPETFIRVVSHKIHTMALGDDGSVWAWGWNEEGQLGANVGCRLTPIRVPGLYNIVDIDVGMLFSVALSAEGVVYAWGRNRLGTMGDDTLDDQSRARPVPGLREDGRFIQISAGHEHVLALHSTGRVYSWGRNRNGQVGFPNMVGGHHDDNIRAWPVHVAGLPNNIVEVAGGGFHSVARTSNGLVYAWGRADRGQLGNGPMQVVSGRPVVSQPVPQRVDIQNVRRITSSGGDANAAILNNGTLWTWGRNNEGQLGDGTLTNRLTPVQVLVAPNQPLTNVISVSVGETHMAAINAQGHVMGWGENWDGQLGNRGLHTSATPLQVRRELDRVNLGLPQRPDGYTYLTGVTHIAVGNLFTLALRDDNRVMGWGRNNHGQLIMQNSIDHRIATILYDFRHHDPLNRFPYIAANWRPINDVVAISAGLEVGHGFGVAIQGDGSVWGWGDNMNGWLGTGEPRRTLGDEPKDNNPRQMLNITNATAIAAGGRHTLVVQGGEVWASGHGGSGRLGDGTTAGRHTPIRLTSFPTGTAAFPAGTTIEQVEAGMASSFAIDSRGYLWAWGYNGQGRLGTGDTGSRLTPTRVMGPSIIGGERILQVSSHANHTLVRTLSGRVWAFGANWNGQIGDGTTYARHTPVRVERLENAVSVAAGGSHSVVALSNGQVWTFGNHGRDQLGRVAPHWADRLVPGQVAGITGATSVYAGAEHSVVVVGTGADNTVWTFGSNNAGALGNGTVRLGAQPEGADNRRLFASGRVHGVHHSINFLNAFVSDFPPTAVVDDVENGGGGGSNIGSFLLALFVTLLIFGIIGALVFGIYYYFYGNPFSPAKPARARAGARKKPIRTKPQKSLKPTKIKPLKTKPITKPTTKPTTRPTVKPSVKPAVRPTVKPTIKPTPKPTVKPTVKPKPIDRTKPTDRKKP